MELGQTGDTARQAANALATVAASVAPPRDPVAAAALALNLYLGGGDGATTDADPGTVRSATPAAADHRKVTKDEDKRNDREGDRAQNERELARDTHGPLPPPPADPIGARLYDLKWHSTRRTPGELREWFDGLLVVLPLATPAEIETAVATTGLTAAGTSFLPGCPRPSGAELCPEAQERFLPAKLVRYLKQPDPDIVDRASQTIAYLSGQGEHITVLQFGAIKLSIHEGTFAGAGETLGQKIWPSAKRLCELLSQRPELVRGKTVIELGCGVRLAGLMAAKLGATRVMLTDYTQEVLSNTESNTAANGCCDTIEVARLNWTDPEASPVGSQKFDVVLLADVIYDRWHADVIPEMCHRYLDPDGAGNGASCPAVIVVLGDRRARVGIPEFEAKMLDRFVMLTAACTEPISEYLFGLRQSV